MMTIRPLAVLLLMTAGTLSSVPPPGPGDGEFDSVSRGGGALDVVGRLRAHSGSISEQGSDWRVPTTGMGEPEFQCPTLTWVYGIYSVEAQNCNNELPTDWAPLLEMEDEVEGTEQSAQRVPLSVSREDVQSLLVDAGGLEVQPDRSWVLVHVETIAFTGAEQQILTTTVLDAPIEVRVTPESFTWDFGDGSEPLVTTDPGAPWPEHTVAHSYSVAQDSAVITVLTEWDAVFRIPGVSPWLPVAGTVVTTETSEPFEVVTATPRLVVGNR